MALSAGEAVARIPGWANASSLRISSLGGGITNQNFRVDVNGESFALRIPGENTELLGINREYEYKANLAAGKLGLAPEVIDFIQPEGCLVTRIINGRQPSPEELRQPNRIRDIAALLRKIHVMPEFPGMFSAFRVVADYSKIVRQHKVGFPNGFDGLIERIRSAEKALTFRSNKMHFCHNDLLNANFLVSDKMYILDWEYAGMGDLFFDLANFSNNHEFSSEQDHWLLGSYFGRYTSTQWAHLKIMQVMSDLREGMWGLVQLGISKLDFDFREYADKFFDRVFANIHNPDWDKWLLEVSTNE
ncbi:MAG: phosphotransferase family protein [Chloroflexi bacterium]|nr:phosphotransferase family protein [Chloroflexota bacterium]